MHYLTMNPLDHYNSEYFEKYQKEIGEFGGKANLFKFEKHIKPSDTVLDFGCGGGFLLKNINCKEKIGVEINDTAREYCTLIHNIKCFKTITEIPDNSIDVIISNHCLEHTTDPYSILTEMIKKIKPKGKIVIVVPIDSYKQRWQPGDVNMHLFSFSPMNIGNLFSLCGLQEVKTTYILHKWPPCYKYIKEKFGWFIFHIVCRIYGRINKKTVQVKGVAIKL